MEQLEAIGFLQRYGRKVIEQVTMITSIRELSPLASGAGRLFDAVSAMIGICDRNTFEGEAAMALEALTEAGIDSEYPVVFTEKNEYTVVDFSNAIRGVIIDLTRKEPNQVIATRFHNTIASAIRTTIRYLHQRTGIRDVALSGGTFQNRCLLTRTMNLLAADALRVYTNVQMPPNDACISLGQAYLVRERLKKGTRS
jgi:hydrogenase maturation protein HypF